MSRNFAKEAGELVLALDAKDMDRVNEILAVVAAEPKGGYELVWQMADLVVESLKLLSPTEWRALLGHIIHDLDTLKETDD